MPVILSLPVPGIYSLPDFSPALTQAAILACDAPIPAAVLIRNMLSLSTYLISIDSQGSFFGARDKSPYSPSLRVLHARLTNGYTAPSTLPAQFLAPTHTEQSTRANMHSGDVRSRPLADFQDLYYALLARMREMQKRMSDHLRSGFSTPTTSIFPFGPTLADLHTTLLSHWDLLNDAACGRAMDDAIREARVQCMQDEIVAQVAGNVMTGDEAEWQIMQLREKAVYDAQAGLEWTPEWDAALVNAKLGEKYRGVLGECRRRDKKDGVRIKALLKQKVEFQGAKVALAERGVGGGVMEVEGVGGEDGSVEQEIDRDEQEWLWQVEQMQHPAFPEGLSIDAHDDEADIDRGEQEWSWPAEQMQHPAFRKDFSLDAQKHPALELVRPNGQTCFVPDIDAVQPVEHVEPVEPMECIQVAQPVKQHCHQQMQQPDGPVPTPAVQQEGNDDDQVAYSEGHLAWRRELEAQRQRVSQYTAYLRSRASVHALSAVENARQSGFQSDF